MTLKNSFLTKLSLYTAALLVWFAVYEYYITPIFPDTFEGYLVSSGVIFLTTTLPGLFLIYQNREDLFLPPPRLWSFSFRPYVILIMMLVMLIYSLTLTGTEDAIIFYDLSQFSNSVMHSIFLDGIAVEIVFRGLLLNALMKCMENWQAVAVNSVLYLLSYVIFWSFQTASIWATFYSGSIILVLVLNIVYCSVFIRKNSLWPSILLHSFWNLCLYIFI